MTWSDPSVIHHDEIENVEANLNMAHMMEIVRHKFKDELPKIQNVSLPQDLLQSLRGAWSYQGSRAQAEPTTWFYNLTV